MIILNIEENLWLCPHEFKLGQKIDTCKICNGILIVDIPTIYVTALLTSSAKEYLETKAKEYMAIEEKLEKENQPEIKKLSKEQKELLNMFVQRKEWIIKLINSTDKIKNKIWLIKNGLIYVNQQITLHSIQAKECLHVSHYDDNWNKIQNWYDALNNIN